MLEKDERTVAGFLVFIGVTALILGFFQTRQGITLGLAQGSSKFKVQSSNNSEGELAEVSKTKDTDNDGLKDFEELTVTRTSPYIADSDSDGIADGEEVKQGTDPNCPKGKTCGTSQGVSFDKGSSDFLSPEEQQINKELQDIALKMQAGQTLSPQEIRALVRQTGMMSNEALDKISDAELIETWKMTMSKNKVSQSESQGGAKLEGQNPSVGEMRHFLKTQGVTEEMLGKISDADLITLWQESLDKVQK